MPTAAAASLISAPRATNSNAPRTAPGGGPTRPGVARRRRTRPDALNRTCNARSEMPELAAACRKLTPLTTASIAEATATSSSQGLRPTRHLQIKSCRAHHLRPSPGSQRQLDGKADGEAEELLGLLFEEAV